MKRLPIKRVGQRGTDHLLPRMGEDMVVRMPIIEWASGQADSDARWLPILEPHLPLSVPVPLAVGDPANRFQPHPRAAPYQRVDLYGGHDRHEREVLHSVLAGAA